MARSKEEIMGIMLKAKEDNQNLTGLKNDSAVSIWRLLMNAIADALFIHEKIFDRHKVDVNELLSAKKPHRKGWYTEQAKLFRKGYDLDPDTGQYKEPAVTDENWQKTVEEARTIKYAAAVESKDKSILYLKIATGKDGKREPVSTEELVSFKAYLDEIKDAGVRIAVINDPADEMKLKMDIYYDMLVLDDKGRRLDGEADTPIQDAIRAYLSNLPFNGTYTNQELVNVLQNIPGVVIARLEYSEARYGAYAKFHEIEAREIAHSGYYTLPDDNLVLNFIANEEIL